MIQNSPAWNRCFRRQGVGPNDFLVAVDGGQKICRQKKWTPAFSIGDWDSSRKLFEPAVTLPRAKARSDFFFALEMLRGCGWEEALAFGFTGGRLDHHLAALQDAAAFRGELGLYDPHHDFYFLNRWNRELGLRLRKGTLVSLFPVGDRAFGVTTRGLVYALKGETLVAGSRGLSNESRGGEVSVKITGGQLVVVNVLR